MAGYGVVLTAEVFLLGLEAALAGFGEEVDEACLGIVIVCHDGGEGEEEERDADDDAAPAVVEQGGEGGDGVFHAGQAEVGHGGLVEVASAGGVDDVVAFSGEEHDSGGGADKQCVDINGETLHKTLLDGVVDFGGGGHDGRGALSGLVAVDAAFDTPGDGCADDAAKGFVVAKGRGYHVAEGAGDGMGVDYQYHDGEDDVGYCHKGGDDFGHPRDALDTTQHNQRNKGGDAKADNPRLEVEGGGEGHGDAVAVDGRQAEGAGDDSGGGKEDGQP